MKPSSWIGSMLVVALASCVHGPETEWTPRDPKRVYPPVPQVAIRVEKEADIAECVDRLGIVHADGDPAEVIGAIAREAAARGGTHYIVRSDRTVEAFKYEPNRAVHDDERRAWAIVYRAC